MTAPRPHVRVAVGERTDHGPAAKVLPFRARPPQPAGASPAPALRDSVLPLVAILFTTVVAQVAVAPHLAPAGATPDLLLLSTAAVAAAGGREFGAAYGFASGLAADLFVATPFGLGALVFTVVGHRMGREAAARPIRGTVMVGGLACLAGGGLLVSVGGLTAGSGPVPPIPVLVRLLGGSIVAAVLAPAVYAAARRLLHPSPAGAFGP